MSVPGLAAPHGAWKPGDRVRVQLPARGGFRGPEDRKWSHRRWFAGTVREVDTGSRPGVRIDLDQEVNGVRDCYATHGELRRLDDGDG